MTLIAVFPPVLFFNVTVIPFLSGISVVLRTLALCVGVTAAVTWVMMPRLMPLVKNWLNAPPSDPAEEGTSRAFPQLGGARRRRGRGYAKPAWLLETSPDDPGRDPRPQYEAPPASRDHDLAQYPAGTRRAPWYGRPQPRYEDDYQTVEFRLREHPNDDHREDGYYEEPRRNSRYDEPEPRAGRHRL